jgi:hypothetical protein
MIPPADVAIAVERGLRFQVCRKAKRGAQWVAGFETQDLAGAVSRARTENDYEVAVFVVTDTGGFQYWTSRHPEVFNSDVIHV